MAKDNLALPQKQCRYYQNRKLSDSFYSLADVAWRKRREVAIFAVGNISWSWIL